ncbi:MAG TPA: hypothetical protein H9822_10870 [Candidatus Yaniella excrementavium]|nr:hypothetical protein [Candidatus Yaniella excrementavium]
MTARILKLTQRPVDNNDGRVRTIDVYDLAAVELADYTGILVEGGCDQRFLATQQPQLDHWVESGGRLVANGHPIQRWLAKMPAHRALDFHTPEELWLYPVGEHPIWRGVERTELIFRTGVPGKHSLQELKRIGVAGFYAHAYLVDLPQGAQTITGIGPGQLPVDVSWTQGDGEVVVHIGNDLSSFAIPQTTTAELAERVLTYLEGR